MLAFSALLVVGKYQAFESVTKWLVLIFGMLAVVALVLTLFKLPGVEVDLLPSVTFTDTTLLFMISGRLDADQRHHLCLSLRVEREEKANDRQRTRQSGF